MKSHGLTLPEYKVKFPLAEIVSQALKDKISAANKGKVRTEEHKANLRASVQAGFTAGRVVHNKGVKGVVKDSEETKAKKRAIHLGAKRSEETRQRMSVANAGRQRSEEVIDKWRRSNALAIEKNGGGFNKGHKHTQEFKDRLSAIAKARTEDQYGPKLEAMWKARREMETSDEQRNRYRDGTIRWMQQNPNRVFNTGVEIAFKEFLNSHNVEFVQQFVIPGVQHPYDFYLPEFNTIVEIDGPQHWKAAIWGTSGKTADEKAAILQRQLEKDAYENLMAGKHGYRIVRVLVEANLHTSPIGSLQEQLTLQGLHI
jgi:very-short-patch-repair endonuclease